MIDYGKVKSTEKPEPLVVDDYSVWVNSNITEVTEQIDENTEFIGYEYNQVQYDKNEYIRLQAEENATLQEYIDDTQLALCEVYELLS